MSCPHEQFAAVVAVARVEDIWAFVADIRVTCQQCGEPFRFVGVPAGLSYDRPMVSIDGLELHAPIEPQGEPALHASARFEMPAKVKAN